MLQFEPYASLKPFNTLNLNSRARYLATVSTEHELLSTLNSVTAQRLPVFILSGGSNVLLSSYLNALVIRPVLKGIKLLNSVNQQVLVEVMAGESWHALVQYTLAQGWYGLENLALIPGYVGAAPIQNIGAYGVEVSQCIHAIRAWHIPTRCWKTLTPDECQFAYRDSIFKQQAGDWVISRVIFKLNLQPQLMLSYGDVRALAGRHPTPRSVAQAIIQIRQAKLPDPAVIANVGSFFKNPLVSQQTYAALKTQYPAMPAYAQADGSMKVAAGWLIDQAGWKGRYMGAVGMYEKQALVLVNRHIAALADIQAVSNAVQEAVRQKFALQLEREPVLVQF